MAKKEINPNKKNTTESIINIYILDNKKYYIYDEIKESYLSLIRGCKTKIEFIKKYKIPEKAITHARLIGEKWEKTNGKNRRHDKLFITKEFADEIIIPKHITYDPLPEILALNNENLFRGSDGEVLNINVVGTWNVDGIYFKLEDVSKAFKMKNLRKAVTNKTYNGYRENIHYKTFCDDHNKKQTYLTFIGFLRILLTTFSLEAQPNINMIINQLWRKYYGKENSKIEIAEDMLKVEPELLKDNDDSNITCIYLFKIGAVHNLRKSMKLDKKYADTDIVYKWGKTINLDNRTTNHLSTYGKIKGSEFILKYYVPIEKHFITEAESDIKYILDKKGYKLEIEHHNELAVIPDSAIDMVIAKYDILSDKYAAIEKNSKKKLIEIECARLEKSKLMFETEYNTRIVELKKKLAMHK